MSGDPTASPAADPAGGKTAKPRPQTAEDGHAQPHNMPLAANVSGHATSGINAQSGQPSGSETERDSPGISTDKNSDDTK